MRSEPAPDHRIVIGGRPIAVKVVRSTRARRWSLRYDQRGDMLRLSLPVRGSVRAALDWAAGQHDWFERVIARKGAHMPLAPDGLIPVQGVQHRIDWSLDHGRRVERGDGVLRVGGEVAGLERRVLHWLRQAARAELSAQTAIFAERLGVSVASVSIGDPRSRWGSCSSSGAIRYSWRLILAPPKVLIATVAHEVAHRVHMHHGPEFHALVATLLGHEPVTERDWLRSHGAMLHSVG